MQCLFQLKVKSLKLKVIFNSSKKEKADKIRLHFPLSTINFQLISAVFR